MQNCTHDRGPQHMPLTHYGRDKLMPFRRWHFQVHFFNENVWIPIKISLKFIPKGPINNIAALVQIMAWRRPGNKPFSEPMMVSLPMHICVTRPQWVNDTFNERKWKHWVLYSRIRSSDTKFNTANKYCLLDTSLTNSSINLLNHIIRL